VIAYHNDPQLKAQFVRLLKWHQEQDKIVQGSYQDDDTAGQVYNVNGWHFESFGRGCAIGCSIESLRIITKRSDLDYDSHTAYEELIGVPRLLARLEDGIFEGLPIEQARQWPARFAEAIPVGADLSRIWPQFAAWLLADPQDGIIKFARTDAQRTAIQHVADLYQQQLDGITVAVSDWRSARAAAAAAAYAAYAAYAAADAAYAAYAAYAAAADAADAAYAADAAKQQARIRQADKLIGLLQASVTEHVLV